VNTRSLHPAGHKNPRAGAIDRSLIHESGFCLRRTSSSGLSILPHTKALARARQAGSSSRSSRALASSWLSLPLYKDGIDLFILLDTTTGSIIGIRWFFSGSVSLDMDRWSFPAKTSPPGAQISAFLVIICSETRLAEAFSRNISPGRM
jgi:hypothetical protein